MKKRFDLELIYRWLLPVYPSLSSLGRRSANLSRLLIVVSSAPKNRRSFNSAFLASFFFFFFFSSFIWYFNIKRNHTFSFYLSLINIRND